MRTVDRVLSLVAALGLVILGVLVPIEVINSRALHRRGHLVLPYESVSGTLHSTEWRSSGVLLTSGAIALIGLILLAAELKPRRAWLLTMADSDKALLAVISRKSAARALTRAALGVERVSTAKTVVKGSRATVRARTSSPEIADVKEQLTKRVAGTVADLNLVRPPRCRVRLGRDPRRHT